MKPPQFYRESSDHLLADHWLLQVRKIFNALKITEDDLRVSIVACQLFGEANEWWESVLGARRDTGRVARAVNRTNELDVESLTLAEFEELFENQYFPETYREQLREQFEKIEQENMTVSNYAIKFQSLSRSAPELIATKERKCRHFEKGLHPSIKLLLCSQQQKACSIYGAPDHLARRCPQKVGRHSGSTSVRPGQSFIRHHSQFQSTSGQGSRVE
ncbi:hypothetical protein RHMOL_Rhmol06G0138600 [Rhododendron molle]|uniref:Uncharacterized protein n=1 Tax=Rhododendron molle TaxID=49168 RepID=A0ACC0NC27_RHOML|nr:hypothetical protein RHMOL_Rhmol06G0138600 [Rhododendron molle]